ncbi:MAG TPA: polysaccharide deacetylase family protein [Candidatus Polarisedimenticolia bacterium]|nr:polysaccharide deacetylase family protein [Candidatus Polarisedimenticolia bacterium]
MDSKEMPPTISEYSRDLVLKAVDRIPAVAWRAMMPRTEIALCYTVVSHESLPHVRPLHPYKNPAQFASDLEFLAGGDAQVSFDDGLVECRTIVAPLLARYGQRATFFINTDVIDNKMMMYRHKLALCISRLEQGALSYGRKAGGSAPRGGGGAPSGGSAGGGASAGGSGRAAPDPSRAIPETTEEDPILLRKKVADLLGVPSPAEVATLRRTILDLRADRAMRAEALCVVTGVDVPAYLAAHRPYLTWAQVRALLEEGHTIGAHGLDHREFQALDSAEIERQIVESCNAVRAVTKQEKIPFAVPFSLEGLDRSLLADIARRNPQVGRIYGTNAFMPEPKGFANRLIADLPPPSRHPGRTSTRTRLPKKIRGALRARAVALARRVVFRDVPETFTSAA